MKHKNYNKPFALKVEGVYRALGVQTNVFLLVLKVCKKSTVVRLKQVQHVRNEKEILRDIDFPFCVKQ